MPELLAIRMATQGDSNGSPAAEPVDSSVKSTPSQMLDSSTNGKVAPTEMVPPIANADSRGKEPIVSHHPVGRRISVGYDEPGLFQDAVKPDQPEPPAAPNGVPRNNIAEGS